MSESAIDELATQPERHSLPHIYLPEGTIIAETGAMLMFRYTAGSRNPKSTELILAFGHDDRPARKRGPRKGKSRKGVLHCIWCDEDLLTEPGRDGILVAREVIAHVRIHDRRKAVQKLGLQLLERVKEGLMAKKAAQGAA